MRLTPLGVESSVGGVKRTNGLCTSGILSKLHVFRSRSTRLACLPTKKGDFPEAPEILGLGSGSTAPRRRGLPSVDWTRYHLQVLFIDKHDTVRARVAAGLFELIAEWNGYGRALYPVTCGVAARQGERASLSTQAGLMHQAYLLGMPPKAFTKACEAFEVADLDRHDVVLALDTNIRDHILSMVDPKWLSYYEEKICLLSDYASYTGAAMYETGGLALLPRRMSFLLQSSPLEYRQVVDIASPCLYNPQTGQEQWNTMVTSVMLGCAGLVKYLIDACPPDLPEYDPL